MYTPHFVSPFIYLWTQVSSIFWLLWIMLLWTCVYRYLFEFLLFFDIYLEEEMLGHMAILHLIFFRNCQYCFPRHLHHFVLAFNFCATVPTVLVLFLIIAVEEKTFSSTFLGSVPRTLQTKLKKDQLTGEKGCFIYKWFTSQKWT